MTFITSPPKPPVHLQHHQFPKPAPFPGFIERVFATLRSKVPTGARFVHELKLDGYRVQAHLLNGRVTLYTRTGLDWTTRFPTIAADVARLEARPGW